MGRRVAPACDLFAALVLVAIAGACSSAEPGPGPAGEVPSTSKGPNTDNGWTEPRGTGQVVGVSPQTNTELCGGDIAATTFRFGLCLCEDLAFATVLETDGSVGTNGAFRSTGKTDIRGSLFAGGDVRPVGAHDIHGELHSGGQLTAAGDIHVFQDAFVAGDIVGANMNVGGALHVPASSRVVALVDAASTVREPVTVAPPCDCSSSSRLDIGGFVAQAAAQNDNAAIGLVPGAWRSLLVPVDLSLPPGKYYLDSVSAIAPIKVHVTQPTALYIGGDLKAASVFEVIIDDPRGELDLFIAGNIVATGNFELGSKTHPAHVRTYVGGGEDIRLAGDLDFGGNLYAPDARIVAAGPLDVNGSLVARSLVEAGIVRIFYDAEVLDAGDNCGEPVPPATPPARQPPAAECTGCQDCNNQACSGGVCGACTKSADCCSPLICDTGLGACVGVNI